MWAILTVVGMIACGLYELISKKAIDNADNYQPFRIKITATIVVLIISMALLFVVNGGEVKSPITTLMENPQLIFIGTSGSLNMLFYLLALNFIGLSIQEAIGGLYGIALFAGLLFVNAITGDLKSVSEIITPTRLIPVLIIVIGSFILPNCEKIGKKSRVRFDKNNQHMMVLGMLLTLVAVGIDVADSILASYVFEETTVDGVEYIACIAIVESFWALIYYIYLFVKTKKAFNPFGKKTLHAVFYGMFYIIQGITYATSAELEPTKTVILWTVYPVIPLVGAYFFLKERYSWKQNACMWMILAASFVFCIVDYI